MLAVFMGKLLIRMVSDVSLHLLLEDAVSSQPKIFFRVVQLSGMKYALQEI